VPPLRLRVACWNLRHGGGNTRTPEQALFLISHAPDIVMLSEYRESRGDQLRAMLSDHGLAHSLTPDAPSTRNRVAILSRWALLPTHQAAWHERLLSAKVTALGIDLIAAHVPDESAETRGLERVSPRADCRGLQHGPDGVGRCSPGADV
jgi:exonuclease III